MHANPSPHPYNRVDAAATESMVAVTEPMEGAFTILMPEGWQNQAYLQREHSLNRIIASSIQPDGGTMIYLSDPRIPYFMEPNPYIDPQLMAFSPSMRMQPYTPADAFFQDYVRQCFSGAPHFRITEITDSPDLQRILEEEARRGEHQPRSTSVRIAFEHHHNGQPLRCLLHGVTAAIPSVWYADLFTVSTTGDLSRYNELALQMVASRRFNPVWANAQRALQAQQLAHQRAMGQQQLDHINNMTRIQTQGHNQRMQDIQNFGQANTRMHEDRMTQSDAQHQSWMNQQAWEDNLQRDRINTIREQHTVIDSGGNAYQVDNHHERYYLNKRDNTYIGVSSATELHDLRRTHGVNPDDYEEVKIVR